MSKYDYTSTTKSGFLYVEVDNKEVATIVDKILDNFHGLNIKKFYKSKYNKYAVYDYEPLFIEGLNIAFEIRDSLSDGVFASNQLKFVEYLIIKKINSYIALEKQHELDIDEESSDGKLIKKLMEV